MKRNYPMWWGSLAVFFVCAVFVFKDLGEKLYKNYSTGRQGLEEKWDCVKKMCKCVNV